MADNEADEIGAEDASGADVADRIDYNVTPSFMALLEQLRCSLVISSYQASTVMTFGSLGQGRPFQMFARFPGAMGLALAGDRLAVAMREDVIVLSNIRSLAGTMPSAPGFHDGYFVPRLRYTVGLSNIHDMVFDGPDIVAVNTNYGCICRLDGFHNFVPLWRPPFLTSLVPADRCHLNGMALDGRTIRYATALGATDTPRGWHEDRYSGGLLMEVPTGRVVADGLCMPHSPRIVANKLYLTEAGTGALVEIDRRSGDKRQVAALPGFARGLAEYRGVMFVGLSLPRGDRPFAGLPVAKDRDDLICGIVALALDTGEVLGTLEYTGGCTEIHDIQIMTRALTPGISDYDGSTGKRAVDLPEIGFWLPEPSDNPQG